MQVGDTLQVTLARDGQPRTVAVPLGIPHRLMPPHLAGAPPQYMVLGGLVLTVLSVPFMEGAFGRRGWHSGAPVQLLRAAVDSPERPDQQASRESTLNPEPCPASHARDMSEGCTHSARSTASLLYCCWSFAPSSCIHGFRRTSCTRLSTRAFSNASHKAQLSGLYYSRFPS